MVKQDCMQSFDCSELVKICLSVWSPRLMTIRQIYRQAFPKEERIPFSLFLLGIMRNRAECIAYMVGQSTVAFAYVLNSPSLNYLFFLAVKPEWQGKGVGTAIVTDIVQSSLEIPVLVTIEPLELSDEDILQRQRRLAFYQANGFVSTDYYYQEGSETYQILSTRVLSDYSGLKALVNTVLYSMISVSIQRKNT